MNTNIRTLGYLFISVQEKAEQLVVLRLPGLGGGGGCGRAGGRLLLHLHRGSAGAVLTGGRGLVRAGVLEQPVQDLVALGEGAVGGGALGGGARVGWARRWGVAGFGSAGRPVAVKRRMVGPGVGCVLLCWGLRLSLRGGRGQEEGAR